MACQRIPKMFSSASDALSHRVAVAERTFYKIEMASTDPTASWQPARTEISAWLASDEAVGLYSYVYENAPNDFSYIVAFDDLPTATAFKLRFT